MNNMLFWEFVHENLQAGEPLLLLLVVDSGGSSPGKAGFKMAVTASGPSHGSIGGGIMERELAGQAVEQLARGRARPRLLKLLHHEGADAAGKRSGMICSGWQRIALLPLGRGDAGAVDSLLFALKRNRPGLLQFTPAGMGFRPGNQQAAAVTFRCRSDDDWAYREQAGLRPTVTIIGGGHVGLALSRVMAGLDFHVRVLDDREGLETMEANAFAQEKHVVNYKNMGKNVGAGGGNYAVIMTFGHQADEIVLKQLVGKKLRYLGMLGSPAKVAQIFASLKKQGVAAAGLKKVHAPVGLPIHSHTPEEIAVSIAAEIISIKNQPKGTVKSER
jgi:xanthine dehydrogenase accessory factor